MSHSVFFRVLGTIACLAALPLMSAAREALPQGIAGAELLPGWKDEAGGRVAAIRLDLQPGWKTYWRVPGEAGIAPAFDFSASTNVAQVEIVWPTPEAFDQEGTRSIGYSGAVIWPLKITPKDPAKPVELVAGLDLGVCHDMCVPARLNLSERLAESGAPDAAIAAALADTPKPAPGLASCSVAPIPDGVRVTARIRLAGSEAPPTAFELRARPMWTSESQERREGDLLIASSDFVPADSKPFDLDTNDLRITVLDPAGAISIDGCAASGP